MWEAWMVEQVVQRSLQTAATCILPKEVNGVIYNGRQGRDFSTRVTSLGAFDVQQTIVLAENSLLIDLDSKFDLLRLIQARSAMQQGQLQQMHYRCDAFRCWNSE